MKRDHSRMIRGFYWASRAWYAKANGLGLENEQIVLGMYSSNGPRETSGEMMIEWIEIQKGKKSPQLQAFDDSWSALAMFADLIGVLGEMDNEDPSPEKIIEILKGCGFQDLTQYEDCPQKGKGKE